MSHAWSHGFAFSGIEAVAIEVHALASSGFPTFTLAGLPDGTARATCERIRSAFAGIGLSMPSGRIRVELSTDGGPGEEGHHDLPVALCVLAAMDVLPMEDLCGYAALGGLSPNGSLTPVPGILSAALGASAAGLGLICPASQGGEAAWAKGVEVLAAHDLLAIVAHFRGTQVMSPPAPPGPRVKGPGPDLADVRGLETARRALEVAAVGGHSLLLVGPPGSGKSTLASCLPGLLPDLEPPDALEASMIHGAFGLLDGGRLFVRPPYRVADACTLPEALVGGGRGAGPGEASLAHGGVLFLDDLPDFPHATLATLRPALETGRATAVRAGAPVSYPARFQLLAAMDPCRCGEDLLGRVGGPFLDRIDMVVHVQRVEPSERGGMPAGEPSAEVANRVRLARARQRARSGGGHTVTDAIEPLPEARRLAAEAAERFRLSARDLARVLRVSRTIAELAGAPRVRRTDVAEALAYRHRVPDRPHDRGAIPKDRDCP